MTPSTLAPSTSDSSVQANAGILATIDGDAPSESRPRKSVFSSKLGFVLAAAGSAVGLGNVWRFPYFAATYGGGTFLFAYLLIALTFGIMLLIAEVAIGRATGHGPVAAFRQLDRRFTSVGVLAMLVPAIIFPFYSVIGGWVTRYAFVFLTGGAAAAAETGAFGAFTSQTWGPIGWLAVFILATAVLVARGINKGIERINLITMPIFIVMLLGLAIYTLTLPGGTEGLRHFLLPDFSELSANTFIAATRQSFFSLSLASGVMVAYGSYMKKSASIEKAAFQIGVFDTTASIIAGLLVIPAVVAIMGIDGLGQGAGLLFATLPHVFASMPGGAIVGAIFFVLMLGAAVTSSISMLEVVVNSLMDRAKWSRLKATVVTSVGGFLFGLPVTLGFGVWSNVRLGGRDILGMMNFLTDTVMMPLVGLGTVLVVGWVIGPQRIIAAVHQDGQLFRTEKMFVVLIKWVGPALLTGLVATSFLMAFGVITL